MKVSGWGKVQVLIRKNVTEDFSPGPDNGVLLLPCACPTGRDGGGHTPFLIPCTDTISVSLAISTDIY